MHIFTLDGVLLVGHVQNLFKQLRSADVEFVDIGVDPPAVIPEGDGKEALKGGMRRVVEELESVRYPHGTRLASFCLHSHHAPQTKRRLTRVV